MGVAYRVVWVLKMPCESFCLKPAIFWGNCIKKLSETSHILGKLHKTNIFRMPGQNFTIVMYIAPSSVHELLNVNLPFKLILRRLRLFSDIWSENAALFERFIHSFIQIHQYYNNSSFLYALFPWAELPTCHFQNKAYSVLLPRSLDTFQCHTYSAQFPLPREHSLPGIAAYNGAEKFKQ